MTVYFNENDKFAAQWLRNLYPDATVDERDIQDVKPADVMGFERVHFFAGIGGWQYALDLAGWTGPVWTGSCPCQPFSDAGKKKGAADERHLWPEFRRLIAECNPTTVFGEQVASKLGREWLAGVRADLEALAYAVGAADLCAAGSGAPHIRQRLWWLAIAPTVGQGPPPITVGNQTSKETRRFVEPGRYGSANGVAIANGQRTRLDTEAVQASQPESSGNGCGLAIADVAELQSESSAWKQSLQQWRDVVGIACRDGCTRRLSAQSGDEPLAHGIPRDLGRRFPELRQLAKGARANRVGRLKGYGNSIVPQVAATFIRAAMESLAAD